MKNNSNLVWLDMEMTGLNPEIERIIEVAMVVTDNELNILAQSPSLAIFQPESLLQQMDDWNRSTHSRTGLIERVRASTLSESEAEVILLDFMKQWVGEKRSPLCGNSVHQDRRFMNRYMPRLSNYFHYRHLDVSTLKELAKRWNVPIARGVVKQGSHLALDDVLESIEEMRYYREHFLIVQP